ncbi:MAG TPA: CHAT domain-containing protein [Mycobacteriales bacterium]|jgi:hypothetical protein|nr:CHAT domain-containing protein [Mycobacteriales bacterium]
MTLPRVVLEVEHRAADAAGARTGWMVTAREWPGGAPLVPPYAMDAAPAAAGGDLPVVPPDRRPPGEGLYADLCGGDAAALAALQFRLETRTPDPGDAVTYGRWLFTCLLQPCWDAVRALPPVEAARGVELALQWPVGRSDLHRLVWESMHDGTSALAGSSGLLVAITRLVPVDVEAPATVTRVPRVLFAVGSPLTDEVVRPGAMFMGLLRSFDAEGICTARVVQDVSAADLAEECARFQPDVVHLVAHGTLGEDGTGRLLLGSSGGDEPSDAPAIAAALATGTRPVAVVLSACWSGAAGGAAGTDPLAAELVARGIPIVSAMAGEVSEQACRLYTKRLVRALHDGEPVVAAAARGRRAALLRSGGGTEQLDWAMPALFLAPSVPPAFAAVDPAATRSLSRLAESLELRESPLFIGRTDILSLVDALVAADRHVGLVGIVREGPLERLGGTRLLREMGLTALRNGHIPLLLGPYGPVDSPGDLRTVVWEVLDRALRVTEQLRLPPPALTVLALDPDLAADAGTRPEALVGLSPDDVHDRVLQALVAFRRGTSRLDPQLVRLKLARDLARLAEAVEAVGPPFGPHTRVLLLCDAVHRWVGAVEPLLSMVGTNGVGTPDRPAPVVLTASLVQDSGAAVRTFRDERAGRPNFVFPELKALAPREAALGYQWVLLHPWRRDLSKNYYDYVYAPAASVSPAQVQDFLATLEGSPTVVVDGLWQFADLLVKTGHFVADDDERAYSEYVGRFG